MSATDRMSLPGGFSLAVHRWGDGPGRPLVVLHGFLEQGQAWRRFAEALAPRAVIAPDHRGHGASDHVGPGGSYHFWDYVSDLDGLLEQLSPEAPVDLLGHSMGGTIAGLYAGTRPERVRRLVLVEGLGPPDVRDQAVERAVQFLAHRRRAPRHGTFPDAQTAADRMRYYNPGIPPDEALRLARAHTRPVQPDDPHVRPGASGGLTWRWDPRHRARSPVPFQADLHRRFLARITAPTLVIDGADTPFVLDDAAARREALSQCTHQVIADAGHLLHHDQPAALAQAVDAFLGDPTHG